MKNVNYMKNIPYTSKIINIMPHIFTENEINVFILGEISPSSVFDAAINLLTNNMHIIAAIPGKNTLVASDVLNDEIPLLTVALFICRIL